MSNMNKKMVSVVLPCRNELDNVEIIAGALEEQLLKLRNKYDYEIIFIDNDSTDGTRGKLREMCSRDQHIRAIFNIVNFPRSALHGILQANGDCCVFMASDLQDPPDLIPEMINKWEKGAKVVCCVKESSDEKAFLWSVRRLYYWLIKRYSTVRQLDQFTGFGLYDRSFIEVMRSAKDPSTSLRGLVAEYGFSIETVSFHQIIRKRGKSKQNFISLFSFAMKNITSYTEIVPHMAVICGGAVAVVGTFLSALGLLLAIFGGGQISMLVILQIVVTITIGGYLAFLIGFVGEYAIAANDRAMNKPRAIEKERLNFSENPKPDCCGEFHPSALTAVVTAHGDVQCEKE